MRALGTDLSVQSHKLLIVPVECQKLRHPGMLRNQSVMTADQSILVGEHFNGNENRDSSDDASRTARSGWEGPEIARRLHHVTYSILQDRLDVTQGEIEW